MIEEQSWVLAGRVAAILPGPPPLWDESGRAGWEQLVMDAARGLLHKVGYRAIQDAMEWDDFVAGCGDRDPIRNLVLRVAMLIGRPRARSVWREQWRRGDAVVVKMDSRGWQVRFAPDTSARRQPNKMGTVFRAHRLAPCVTMTAAGSFGPGSVARRLPQTLR
jgi:hypothetical protein